MNQSIKNWIIALFVLGTFTACSSKDETAAPSGKFAKGIFVLNQGQFGTPNGSISFLADGANSLENDVFTAINARPLGDVVQSMSVLGDKGYIVVNNSNKIEIVNASTMLSTGVINDLKQPRYLAAANADKAYLSEWSGGYAGIGRVSVINLKTNMINKSINLGIAPDQILLTQARLFALNSGANTISVINTATDELEKTLIVKDYPSDIGIDKNGTIWVMCQGKAAWTGAPTAGALAKINPLSLEISFINFPSGNPSGLAFNSVKDKLYFNWSEKIWSMDITAGSLPSTALINRSLSSLSFDTKNNYLLGTNPLDYRQSGWLVRYKDNGQKLDSMRAGLIPAFIYQLP
jgi:YVTN family beta-propeller protein